MPAPSIKKRYCPSGPVFADQTEGAFKYIDGVTFPQYDFDATNYQFNQTQQVLIHGIDPTYDVLVNPTPNAVEQDINPWLMDIPGPFGIVAFYIFPTPVMLNLLPYYPVRVSMAYFRVLAGQELDSATLTANLMFFKKGTLVTEGIVPP